MEFSKDGCTHQHDQAHHNTNVDDVAKYRLIWESEAAKEANFWLYFWNHDIDDDDDDNENESDNERDRKEFLVNKSMHPPPSRPPAGGVMIRVNDGLESNEKGSAGDKLLQRFNYKHVGTEEAMRQQKQQQQQRKKEQQQQQEVGVYNSNAKKKNKKKKKGPKFAKITTTTKMKRLPLVPASFIHSSMRVPNLFFQETSNAATDLDWSIGLLIASKLERNYMYNQSNENDDSNKNVHRPQQQIEQQQIKDENDRTQSNHNNNNNTVHSNNNNNNNNNFPFVYETVCYPGDAGTMKRASIDLLESVLMTTHGKGCRKKSTTLCIDHPESVYQHIRKKMKEEDNVVLPLWNSTTANNKNITRNGDRTHTVSVDGATARTPPPPPPPLCPMTDACQCHSQNYFSPFYTTTNSQFIFPHKRNRLLRRRQQQNDDDGERSYISWTLADFLSYGSSSYSISIPGDNNNNNFSSTIENGDADTIDHLNIKGGRTAIATRKNDGDDDDDDKNEQYTNNNNSNRKIIEQKIQTTMYYSCWYPSNVWHEQNEMIASVNELWYQREHWNSQSDDRFYRGWTECPIPTYMYDNDNDFHDDDDYDGQFSLSSSTGNNNNNNNHNHNNQNNNVNEKVSKRNSRHIRQTPMIDAMVVHTNPIQDRQWTERLWQQILSSSAIAETVRTKSGKNDDVQNDHLCDDANNNDVDRQNTHSLLNSFGQLFKTQDEEERVVKSLHRMYQSGYGHLPVLFLLQIPGMPTKPLPIQQRPKPVSRDSPWSTMSASSFLSNLLLGDDINTMDDDDRPKHDKNFSTSTQMTSDNNNETEEQGKTTKDISLCKKFWNDEDCDVGYRKVFVSYTVNFMDGSCLFQPKNCGQNVFFFPNCTTTTSIPSTTTTTTTTTTKETANQNVSNDRRRSKQWSSMFLSYTPTRCTTMTTKQRTKNQNKSQTSQQQQQQPYSKQQQQQMGSSNRIESNSITNFDKNSVSMENSSLYMNNDYTLQHQKENNDIHVQSLSMMRMMQKDSIDGKNNQIHNTNNWLVFTNFNNHQYLILFASLSVYTCLFVCSILFRLGRCRRKGENKIKQMKERSSMTTTKKQRE